MQTRAYLRWHALCAQCHEACKGQGALTTMGYVCQKCRMALDFRGPSATTIPNNMVVASGMPFDFDLCFDKNGEERKVERF